MAAAQEKLLTNPSKGVELPKDQPVREMRPLTQKEARRVLEAARDQRLGAYFDLALATGMRPGELFGSSGRRSISTAVLCE